MTNVWLVNKTSVGLEMPDQMGFAGVRYLYSDWPVPVVYAKHDETPALPFLHFV